MKPASYRPDPTARYMLSSAWEEEWQKAVAEGKIHPTDTTFDTDSIRSSTWEAILGGSWGRCGFHAPCTALLALASHYPRPSPRTKKNVVEFDTCSTHDNGRYDDYKNTILKIRGA
jgi:hypothetical protein